MTIENSKEHIKQLNLFEDAEPQVNPHSLALRFRRRLAIGLGIALSSTIGIIKGADYISDRESTKQDQNAVTSQSSPAPATSIELEKTLIPFEQFQRPNNFSQTTIDLSYRSALKLRIGDGVCSGTIINGYLVTASHCGADERGISARYYRQAKDGTADYTDTASKWTVSEPNKTDLLFAKINNSGELPNIFFPVLSNDNPNPGDRMITSTLPGDELEPILGSLTYLREEPAVTERPIESQHGAKWVFALGPDNSPKATESLCDHGASGSAIIDDYGHIGILTNVTHKDAVLPEEWENTLSYNQVKTGSKLEGVTAFCLATPVPRDTFNVFMNALN